MRSYHDHCKDLRLKPFKTFANAPDGSEHILRHVDHLLSSLKGYLYEQGDDKARRLLLDHFELQSVEIKGETVYAHPQFSTYPYRGFRIKYDPPPIPLRGFDWSAVHDWYDAADEGDNGLSCHAPTLDEVVERIDEMYEEHEMLQEVGA